jgi:Ribose/xylose/arabinose/galactoside ABC-type transport systems, permease components
MTLAVQTIARGAALLITGGNNIKGMRASFAFLGQGNAGPIPISVILLLVLFFISYIILNKTPFGRHVYAVGGNIHAAEASGINTKNVQIKAFIYDGLMTAIASVVFMSRLNTGIPAAAEGYEFDAITAVVVGGTSLAGGSGSIVGTVLGAVIVGIINNVQILMGVHTNWQKVVKGIVILLAVIVDILTKRASAKQK